jgi:hypothetical protein
MQNMGLHISIYVYAFRIKIGLNVEIIYRHQFKAGISGKNINTLFSDLFNTAIW